MDASSAQPSPPSLFAGGHRSVPSSAWPLAGSWALLIVYASLFPFSGWRSTGMPWWGFMTAPFSRYWTGFDVVTNLVGYVPFGFLMTLGMQRDAQRLGRHWALLLAWLAGSVLSLSMETLQVWLPGRVASNLDWLLNTAGTLVGALLSVLLERAGLLGRWSQFRARWFSADARGSLVLLVLWPAALLYPTPIPFGLGQVMERAENQLAQWLQGTPWIEWLPLRAIERQPMLPQVELLVVALALFVPCLLAYGVMGSRWRRLLAAALVLAAGCGALALSAGVSYGADFTWNWLWGPVRQGVGAAGMLALACLWLPRRACWVIALVAQLVMLQPLNEAAVSAYYVDGVADGLTTAYLLRFFGLTQWLGWLWPYAVLLYLVVLLAGWDTRERF